MAIFNRDDFWASADCLPGMNLEQTQTYLRELEEKSRDQSRSGVFGALAAGARDRINLNRARPGVDAAALDAWENEHGVTLPKLLRTVLGWQNGGYFRESEIEIFSLNAIVPVDDDFGRFDEIPKSEAADQSLVFVFGTHAEDGAQLLLNFNARGPTNEPSVYIYYNDGTGAKLIAKSLDEFLAEDPAFSTESGVDWARSQEGIVIIASEAIDFTYVEGGRGRLEQVLGRTGEAVVLVTRLEDSDGVELTRTVLPLPLDDFDSSIEPCRTGPTETFGLHLQPEEIDGIVCVQSTQTKDGRWENRTTHGMPIYGLFESTSSDRLEDLRKRLFESSASPRSKDKYEVKSDPTAFDRINSLSLADRRIATLLAAQKVKAEAEAKLAANSKSINPAEAMFARYKIERMDEAIARALTEGATLDIDHETRRRVEAVLWPK